MMDGPEQDYPRGEVDAMDLMMTIQTPGWSLVERRLRRMVEEARQRLEGGGKDRHEQNLGYLYGIKAVLTQTKVWFEEAQAFIEKERT